MERVGLLRLVGRLVWKTKMRKRKPNQIKCQVRSAGCEYKQNSGQRFDADGDTIQPDVMMCEAGPDVFLSHIAEEGNIRQRKSPKWRKNTESNIR